MKMENNSKLRYIERNLECNLINTNGKLIIKKWFDYLLSFKGDVIFERDCNERFTPVPNKWFDWTSDFSNGYASIVKDSKLNIINQEGIIQSKIWFDWIQACCSYIWVGNDKPTPNKFYIVKLGRKYNIIDLLTKKFVSSIWFDHFEFDMKKEIIEILIGCEQYTLDRRGNIRHSCGSKLESEFVLTRRI